MQPQYTSIVPQFTAFNPYQQQAEQEAAQAEFLRQQQLFLLQQQQAQQAQQQHAQQEEWLRQQQLLQLQQQQQQQQQSLFVPAPSLHPQPTGFGCVVFLFFFDLNLIKSFVHAGKTILSLHRSLRRPSPHYQTVVRLPSI
jgi:hypothetical protein